MSTSSSNHAQTLLLLLWLLFCLAMVISHCSGQPGTQTTWPPDRHAADRAERP